MLLREIKNIFHKELDALYPKEEVNSFFYLLIGHYFNLERFVLAMQPNYIISKEEEQPMFEALAKLKLHKPIQHIIGSAYFMGMDFIVNENTLIPRPETEELVRWVIEEVRSTRYKVQSEKSKIQSTKYKVQSKKYKVQSTDALKILDIGSGSGCIAISLAKNFPNAKIVALDVSAEALEIAEQNAVDNGVTIEFIQADILETNILDMEFDVIVSNPPYVRELEKQKMNANVLENEPDLALFVPDGDPLVFYKKIAAFATENLNVDGCLFFEINQYLGKETQQLLSDHNFSEIELRKDLFGNDRMLKATQR